ncbi:MAG: NUDIX domain-containing protein [Candidatus Bipolaricaulota bacterium]|nr:MAG: NUDIX domain-containing protein [Candidatus Bipolaricaulota bacterium]
MTEVVKVFVYVVSGDGPEAHLLLFESLDEPGFEVPKGAVERDESVGDAVRREVHEEAGVSDLRRIHLLGTTLWEEERQHFFVARTSSDGPDRFAHTVTGDGIDAGFVYRFRWQRLATLDARRLVQGCGAFFPELTAYLADSSSASR